MLFRDNPDQWEELFRALTVMDKTMTMEKLQDLLDPTQPTDVGALTNIVDFFKFPIKLETRPAVLTGWGY